MFSPGQQKIYRPLVERAWRAHHARNPSATDKRGWYETELYQAIGMTSTRTADHVQDFDQAMLHFSTIAGDDQNVAHFSAAQHRRMTWLIEERLRKLSATKGHHIGWPYAVAIYEQMSRSGRLPENMDDCPAELLHKVFQALDAHCRRTSRRRHLEPAPF